MRHQPLFTSSTNYCFEARKLSTWSGANI